MTLLSCCLRAAGGWLARSGVNATHGEVQIVLAGDDERLGSHNVKTPLEITPVPHETSLFARR